MNREFQINLRGEAGENYVCTYLENKDYEILSRNYHSRYGEIDIVARKNNTIAFVEVKTGTLDSLAGGFERITKSKLRKIFKTAADYLMKNNLLCHSRIDCAQVTVNGADNRLLEISYIENVAEQTDGYSPY